MATTQKTEAIRIRRLKKADFEVDFFFMNEVEFFLSGGTRESNSDFRWEFEYVPTFFLDFLV